MVRNQFAQIELATGVIDVDSDQVALAVVIQNNAFRNFAALDTRSLREIDLKRIRIWEVIQFHGRNLRSRNALRIVSLSERVITRKKRTSSSSIAAQKR